MDNKMDMPSDLLHCPFCGKTHKDTIIYPVPKDEQYLTSQNDVRVACGFCGVKGRKASSHQEARQLWNTRIAQPAPDKGEALEALESLAERFDFESERQAGINYRTIRAALTQKPDNALTKRIESLKVDVRGNNSMHDKAEDLAHNAAIDQCLAIVKGEQ